MTGAFLASPAYLTLVCSDTRLHSLSRLTAGCQRFELLEWTWKFLIPTLPKYPGWYLSKLILWWCWPPALPRPPGCFLCLPMRPWPWDTWPLNFLVFFLLVDIITPLVEVNQAILAPGCFLC